MDVHHRVLLIDKQIEAAVQFEAGEGQQTDSMHQDVEFPVLFRGRVQLRCSGHNQVVLNFPGCRVQFCRQCGDLIRQHDRLARGQSRDSKRRQRVERVRQQNVLVLLGGVDDQVELNAQIETEAFTHALEKRLKRRRLHVLIQGQLQLAGKTGRVDLERAPGDQFQEFQ